ncbi:hypothetical protein AGDE_06966 [Angomonas deanei]|nr:hypothetical protein AGDE_07937 [Angomonas deanei]EPY36332.1 hypothetical protein AGDE_06966 [Angomonas deanei]|eukprot:EPY34396.1 hypothetical protein AGDE_07937 [Angomonas deanei]
MPRPKFVTCKICGKGFGSASIDIHVPQCYEKALKQWKINPVGPRPVMPGTKPPQATSSSPQAPVGGGAAAARSLKQNQVFEVAEYDNDNPNLHPCSKCGRKFNFDRIGYHESVCKGDQKRRVFRSERQRSITDGNGEYSVTPAPKSKRTGGQRGGYKVDATKPIPSTNWRQQHEEFIRAVRSAKQADSSAQQMWGAPKNARGGAGAGRGRGGRGAAPKTYTRSTVPANMVRQNRAVKENIATGGRMARAAESSIEKPGRSKPTRDTMGGGGGGGYRIANDNTTSLGTLQAFGRA